MKEGEAVCECVCLGGRVEGALMNTSATSHCDIFTAATHQTCEEADGV